MCMIDACDERVTPVDHGRYVVARKDHRCKECGRGITKGERYHTEAFVSDGRLCRHKTCAHCMVVRDWLAAECSGWAYGCVEEDAREHVVENPRYYGIELLRAVVGMRRHRRTRKGRLMQVFGPIRTSDQLNAERAARSET